jgi:hypothetical protein
MTGLAGPGRFDTADGQGVLLDPDTDAAPVEDLGGQHDASGQADRVGSADGPVDLHQAGDGRAL